MKHAADLIGYSVGDFLLYVPSSVVFILERRGERQNGCELLSMLPTLECE